eukprot:scaffold46033_cov35-Attheya_sp.AAC.1
MSCARRHRRRRHAASPPNHHHTHTNINMPQQQSFHPTILRGLRIGKKVRVPRLRQQQGVVRGITKRASSLLPWVPFPVL